MQRVPLNDSWLFAPSTENGEWSFKDAPQTVDLPHNAVATPAHYFSESRYQGRFLYQKKFAYEGKEEAVTLVFAGAMLQFDLRLNGIDLGHYVSGYFPVRVRIEKYLKQGENDLQVLLSSEEDPDIPPFGKKVDYLTFAGLYREVHLEVAPLKGHIVSLWGRGHADGRLCLHMETEGEGEPTFALYEGTHLVKEFHESEIKIDHPRLYTADNPYLYQVVARFGEDRQTLPIAFRDAKFTEEGFFLNGSKFKLRGLNRHQTFPYFGSAAPERLQREDAQILKYDLSCNVVRTSHYADDEAFLNECDRIGLFVIDEIPGWQYIGKGQKWRDQCIDFAKRLIEKERRHPSVIAYGLRIDESPDDHELYSAIRAVHQEMDPDIASIGVRNFKHSELLEDVYGYNDFSGHDIFHQIEPVSTWKGAKGHATFVSEHNGHMFPTKSFDPTDRRIEHALRHARALDDAYAQEKLSGITGWCAFDYNTHADFGSDDHICYHGVSDINRLPKFAAFVYASQGDDAPVMEIASSLAQGDFDAASVPPAYVFTNCDYVTLWKNGKKVKDFYPCKKEFPHLPHPPVKIDDWIGETWDEPRFSKRDSQVIIHGLNYASEDTSRPLPLSLKLAMARILLKYHLSPDEVPAIYAKYIASWGEEATVFEFAGYKNGKEVCRKRIGPSGEAHLSFRAVNPVLVNGETYDAMRVEVLKKDEYGVRVPFGDDAIEVSVKGPIALMGPRLLSLSGGGTSLFVRSLPVEKPSKATLTVRSEEEEISLQIEVR